MKTREEAIAEAQAAGEARRQQAKQLKAEGLSRPAIARAMGITGIAGMPAVKMVDNLLRR
jgi:hypothetical protein